MCVLKYKTVYTARRLNVCGCMYASTAVTKGNIWPWVSDDSRIKPLSLMSLSHLSLQWNHSQAREKSRKSDEVQKGKCQMLLVESAHFRRNFFWASAGKEQRSRPGKSKAKRKAQLICWMIQESCNKRWMVKTLNKSLFLKGQEMSCSDHQVRNRLQPWH